MRKKSAAEILKRVPRSFTLSSNAVLEALTEPLNSIETTVKSAFEQTPPELAADIGVKGMVIARGGALLRDIERLLMVETCLPACVADNPLRYIARGCGVALGSMDKTGMFFTTE